LGISFFEHMPKSWQLTALAVGAGEDMLPMSFIFMKKDLTAGGFFSSYPLHELNHHSLSVLGNETFLSHQE